MDKENPTDFTESVTKSATKFLRPPSATILLRLPHPNAVKTQIWIAVSVYVLVAIVKKRLALDQSLYTLLQILSLSLFEKMPILQAFSQINYNIQNGQNDNQLPLFNL